MSIFTTQERRAVLFLLCLALLGTCCAAYAAIYPHVAMTVLAEQSAKLDINRASAADLTRSRVVSRTLARRIIECRARIGRFDDMEQLLDVKGIGIKRLKRLKAFCYAGQD